MSKTVLLIDDEPDIREVAQLSLGAVAGWEVLTAGGGAEGIELAATRQPDAILLDVMMPELDGWSVARELAADERTRDIPFVFLTARADPADRRLGEQLGGVGYLVKPFDPVTIGDFVESVLVRVERGEREQLRRGISSQRER
jgi:CheY-like chemotaxis protein